MIRTTLLVAAVSPAVAGCATASRGSCDSSPVPVALPSWEVPGLEDATGAATLSVLVDQQGRTRDLRIQESSGHPMFDETIRFAVQSTRFEPARVNCDPVEQWMTVTVPVGHVGTGSYLNKDEMHMALVRDYPPLLRNTGTGGTVVVLAHIDEQGVVRQTQVFTSSGHRALDQAALRVARIARFVPTVHDGQATSAWGTMHMTFETR